MMITMFALGPFAPHLCVFFSQVLNICFLLGTPGGFINYLEQREGLALNPQLSIFIPTSLYVNVIINADLY